MKTHKRCKQNKHSTPRQKQSESQYTYHIGTNSNIKLLGASNGFSALTSPSAPKMSHNIELLRPRGESSRTNK